jgi:hypothetical protein
LVEGNLHSVSGLEWSFASTFKSNEIDHEILLDKDNDYIPIKSSKFQQ